MIIITLIKARRIPFYCLGFLLFGQAALFGQALRNIPYYSTDETAARQKLADETAASIRSKFQAPEKLDKEAKKAYMERREYIAENVAAEINQTAIPDDALWTFLKNTHAVIIAANPECAATKIILTSSPVPNAFSVGDGTIVVYTGLLAGLENEDQLAFVLCHEIAHFLLEHSTKGLVKEINTYYSKEFKDKVKAANQVEFNRNEQLENIYKNVLFNSRYHHRDLERQADSLAYRLFLKTPYAPTQAQRLIQLFEYMDEPLRDSTLRLNTHFGSSQYPFQQHWLEKSQGSVWGETKILQSAAEKTLRDSLSTHPDWQNRLHWIEALAQLTSPDVSKIATPENGYTAIKYLSTIESVESWFNHERYDKSLYYAMQYQSVYPECAYFNEIEALSLYRLYTHSKDHDLASVLSKRSPDHSEKYNQFLDFLNNLRLKDLLALQNWSLSNLGASKTEYGLLAAYCIAEAQEDRSSMIKLKREYLSTYRNGRFVEFFKTK